ncbi:MAG: SAM-dependent methyltransferase [Mediterranea sp.]|jgi:ubiquinone/menaquinone biosynthesis C-methylase UbiE|nr:SAM-dependent methyltransferase [Mediterranea sp.]
MNLFPALNSIYTKEQLSARDAQRLAEFIAFGPIVFQVSRLMIKFGILDMLRNSHDGLTREEIACKTGLSDYAVKVLTDASLTIGSILLDTATERFSLSKTGWFLLNDPATRVNIDFNHDVNYEGWFHLEEALLEGKPAGLKHFGDWNTIYEGLSQIPEPARKSWLAFDHFYSDSSFDKALEIVFSRPIRTLLDVGGNTGRWAMRCVEYDHEVNVTIMDLPQQLEMMRSQTDGKSGADRITGYEINLLDTNASFPTGKHFNAVWMSQFLDCFGEEEIAGILRRAAKAMTGETRLYIMETFWDRQKYEPAAFCLTQISLYFTAMANGNSKMYHSEDMQRLVEAAGLRVETIHDHLGQGHSIMVCKL